MSSINKSILAINCGSSSIKFALYEISVDIVELLSGEIESIGTKNTNFSFDNLHTNQKGNIKISAAGHENATDYLINWLEQQNVFVSVTAIGHRIVLGMKHTAPELITSELLEELKKISTYDPDHLPEEIKLIALFSKHYKTLPQIACFDTAFHTSMPEVAKLFAIPRRYKAIGIQRYGFHGLSYTFLMEELERVANSKTAQGKIIIAHLGSGASLAAVKNGNSMDTSMGFTPTSGIPMSTRTGDLDPGVAWYLMQSEKLTPEQFNHLVNYESGLLGISETSSDMRDLIKIKKTDNRAAEAIELFCYQTKKWIGSFATVLEGLDTLIFSGGIGEHSPDIRNWICTGMKFLGIELDAAKNIKNEPIISTRESKVCIRVIKTNEELMIARMVCRVMNYDVKQ